jgi:enediyne biosynthesis protein E4
VHFGFGSYTGPVTVHIQWRDTAGTLHQQTQQLTQGTHALVLTSTIQEVPGS